MRPCPSLLVLYAILGFLFLAAATAPSVQGVGLGSLTLTAMDGDGDAFNDFVKVEQRVVCDSGGTYNVTAKLFAPSVDYLSFPDSYIDIRWWRQVFSSCSGTLTVGLELYTNVDSPAGSYNVTVTLTHSTAIPDPDNRTGQVFLYPKRLISFDLTANASLKESEPGTQVVYGISVTNRGNFQEGVSLSASTLSNWSVSVSPITLTVEAGETRQGNVTVTVPQNAPIETKEKVQVLAASNSNASYSKSLYVDVVVGIADLMVLTDDVTFSKTNPSPGETVKVRATIRNGGSKDATGVKVGLFENGNSVESATISFLSKGQTTTLEFSWTASAGSHRLVVVVDPEEAILDQDRTNNRVEKVVSVAGVGGPAGYDWLLFVGIVVGGLVLAILLVSTGTIKLPHTRGRSTLAPSSGGPTTVPTDIDIKPGKAYLLEEDKPYHVVELVKALNVGNNSLIITRSNPQRLTEERGLKAARLLWLADKASPSEMYEVVSPSLERLMYTVEVHAREVMQAVVVIDGVEYLIDNNNFNAVLRFLRRLVDLVSQTEAILLVSVSPKALSERELKILEREMEVFCLE